MKSMAKSIAMKMRRAIAAGTFAGTESADTRSLQFFLGEPAKNLYNQLILNAFPIIFRWGFESPGGTTSSPGFSQAAIRAPRVY